MVFNTNNLQIRMTRMSLIPVSFSKLTKIKHLVLYFVFSSNTLVGVAAGAGSNDGGATAANFPGLDFSFSSSEEELDSSVDSFGFREITVFGLTSSSDELPLDELSGLAAAFFCIGAAVFFFGAASSSEELSEDELCGFGTIFFLTTKDGVVFLGEAGFFLAGASSSSLDESLDDDLGFGSFFVITFFLGGVVFLTFSSSEEESEDELLFGLSATFFAAGASS